MVLKFKQRGVNDLKKVLIYGEDGTGKSTFAEEYCNKQRLKPVVIDIDDTNYTNLPILNIDLSSDMVAYRNIKKSIAEIVSDGGFDTIIIDGVTSMLEVFVSKAKGLKKYSDRAERFNDILKDLLNSGMNLIFIGQIDMKVIHNEEFQSPKPIIKVNSLVNEKYICYHKKNGYSHKVVKYRVCETAPQKTAASVVESETEPVKVMNESIEDDVFMTAATIGEPRIEDDPVRNMCIEIKTMLEKEGMEVTKTTMKAKVIRLIQDEVLPPENRPALMDYIQKHCPEELP